MESELYRAHFVNPLVFKRLSPRLQLYNIHEAYAVYHRLQILVSPPKQWIWICPLPGSMECPAFLFFLGSRIGPFSYDDFFLWPRFQRVWTPLSISFFFPPTLFSEPRSHFLFFLPFVPIPGKHSSPDPIFGGASFLPRLPVCLCFFPPKILTLDSVIPEPGTPFPPFPPPPPSVDPTTLVPPPPQ